MCNGVFVWCLYIAESYINCSAEFSGEWEHKIDVGFIDLHVEVAIIVPRCSLVPGPLPDFISQWWRKIWEWPGDETNLGAISVHCIAITLLQ